MTELQVLRIDQGAHWTKVLQQTSQHDIYHLPYYHALAEQQGEGTAHLFVYREGPYLIALPLLLRAIADVDGLDHLGQGWWDATSVYGYAGPLASHAELPPATLRNFHRALRERLEELRVVTVFSRLHPLLPQPQLLAGLGQCVATGQTVSIDLTLPPDVQRAKYRKNHLRDIKRLGQLGVTCLHDRESIYLREFLDIYYQTMDRVGAARLYFFGPGYFEDLVCNPQSPVRLFVCLHEGTVICGALMTIYDGIVQYHLGGTRNEALRLAPMKLLFDLVRSWSYEQGAWVFHLGGGFGAQEDSLFQFKAGFSDRRHQFFTWRWVLFPAMHDQLCDAKRRWNEQRGLESLSTAHFPAYRSPTTAVGVAVT